MKENLEQIDKTKFRCLDRAEQTGAIGGQATGQSTGGVSHSPSGMIIDILNDFRPDAVP